LWRPILITGGIEGGHIVIPVRGEDRRREVKLGIAGVEPVEAQAQAQREAVHRPFVLHVKSTLAAHFVGRSQRRGWTAALDGGIPAHQAAVDLTNEWIGTSVRSKREADWHRYSQPRTVVG